MSEKVSFEKSMERLEQIVRAMERGDAPLDESLKLFQEGTQLVRACSKMLEEAQLEINKVIKTADGSPAMEVFEDGSDA